MCNFGQASVLYYFKFRLKAIGVTGEVVRVSKGGSVYVNFVPMGQYRFNPKALVKVSRSLKLLYFNGFNFI